MLPGCLNQSDYDLAPCLVCCTVFGCSGVGSERASDAGLLLDVFLTWPALILQASDTCCSDRAWQGYQLTRRLPAVLCMYVLSGTLALGPGTLSLPDSPLNPSAGLPRQDSAFELKQWCRCDVSCQIPSVCMAFSLVFYNRLQRGRNPVDWPHALLVLARMDPSSVPGASMQQLTSAS